MTQTYSQKRYRHNNNNTAPRFRDQPPRFKRQKSNTDPEGENCENFNIASSGALKASVDNTVLQNTMKNPLKMVNGEVMRMVPVQPNMPQLSVDTDMVNQFNTQSVNTSFSYRDLAMCPLSYSTPPFSPVSTSSTISVHEMSGYPQTSSPVRFASPYNVSPCLEMANVKNSGWISPSNISSQNNASSRTKNPNQEDKVVYSDPDKQTILLLRELERVADEKEKEDQQKEKEIGNNNGTDRKNLVSHHLRMLMCAVDRYTADVDETSSSDGGISEASASPAPSPCPTPTPKCQTPQSSGQWQMKQSRNQRLDTNLVNRHGELKSQQLNVSAPNNIAWNRSPPNFSKSVPPPCIPFYSSPPPSLISRNSYPTPPPSREPTPTSYQPSYNNVPYNTVPTVNSNLQMPLVHPTKPNTDALPTPQESLAHILSPMSSSSSQYNYGMIGAGSQAQNNGWNLWNSPSFMPFEQYKR